MKQRSAACMRIYKMYKTEENPYSIIPDSPVPNEDYADRTQNVYEQPTTVATDSVSHRYGFDQNKNGLYCDVVNAADKEKTATSKRCFKRMLWIGIIVLVALFFVVFAIIAFLKFYPFSPQPSEEATIKPNVTNSVNSDDYSSSNAKQVQSGSTDKPETKRTSRASLLSAIISTTDSWTTSDATTLITSDSSIKQKLTTTDPEAKSVKLIPYPKTLTRLESKLCPNNSLYRVEGATNSERSFSKSLDWINELNERSSWIEISDKKVSISRNGTYSVESNITFERQPRQGDQMIYEIAIVKKNNKIQTYCCFSSTNESQAGSCKQNKTIYKYSGNMNLLVSCSLNVNVTIDAVEQLDIYLTTSDVKTVCFSLSTFTISKFQ